MQSLPGVDRYANRTPPGTNAGKRLHAGSSCQTLHGADAMQSFTVRILLFFTEGAVTAR